MRLYQEFGIPFDKAEKLGLSKRLELLELIKDNDDKMRQVSGEQV